MPVLSPLLQAKKCMEDILEKLGAAMCTLTDCDWQMNGPRSAASCSSAFCEISHTVLYL